MAQIKSGEVIYKVMGIEEKNDDLENSDDKIINYLKKDDRFQSSINRERERIKKALPHLEFTLEFSDNESLFTGQKTMTNDNKLDLFKASLAAGANGIFYTNIRENIILQQMETYYGEMIILTRNADDLKWEIQKETKNILGYQCRKASTMIDWSLNKPKMEIVAWFTTELPFSFGPIEFAGLPGLILGLERNQFYWYADKIELKEKVKSINKPLKGKKITAKEYNEQSRKKQEDIRKRFEAAGF